MSRYVLDACALIALLRDEEGADIVAGIMNNANNGEAEIIINKLNLLEIYYDVYRSLGKERADLIISEIKKRPIEIISEITDEVFMQAGRLKAAYKISLADSIALAQTIVSNGFLLTADHHEFDIIEKSGENIKFSWIRL